MNSASNPLSRSASPRSARMVSPAISPAYPSSQGHQPSHRFTGTPGSENRVLTRSLVPGVRGDSQKRDGVPSAVSRSILLRPEKQNSLDVGALASERGRLMHAGSGSFHWSDLDPGGAEGGGEFEHAEQSGSRGRGRASFGSQDGMEGSGMGNGSSSSVTAAADGHGRRGGRGAAARQVALSGAGTTGAYSSHTGSSAGMSARNSGHASGRPAVRRIPAVSVDKGSSFLAASSSRDNLGDFELESLSSCQLASLLAAHRAAAEAATDWESANQAQEGKGKVVGMGAAAGGQVKDYGRRQSAYATLWAEEGDEDKTREVGSVGDGRGMQAPSTHLPGAGGGSTALASKKSTDVVTTSDLPGFSGASEWEHAVLGSIQELTTSGSSSSGRTSSGSFQERRKAGMGVILGSISSMGARLMGKGGPRDHILQQPYEQVESRYALQREELGSGQYGVIRKCMEIKTGRVFACKTLKKEGIRVCVPCHSSRGCVVLALDVAPMRASRTNHGENVARSYQACE